MSVKTKVDLNALAGNIRNIAKSDVAKATDKVLPELARQIAKDMDSYVPYDTGALAESVSIGNDGSISYDADYAEYIYNKGSSTNWTKDHHPLATGDWVTASAIEYLPKWQKDLKRLVGG